jgi:hypothetical protein
MSEIQDEKGNITSKRVIGNRVVVFIVAFNNISVMNPGHGKVYSIQHYVIKFTDMRQVVGLLRSPSPIKLTAMI